jgi:hypothetical protein
LESNSSLESKKWDSDNLFEWSIYNSRLCLCPLGASGHSQRFFEVMSIGKVPVFFGERNIKFPLDWVIDWKNLIPIIYIEDLNSNKCIDVIEEWLDKSDDELNEVGRKCRNIYFKYFYDWNILKREIRNRMKNSPKIGFHKL